MRQSVRHFCWDITVKGFDAGLSAILPIWRVCFFFSIFNICNKNILVADPPGLFSHKISITYPFRVTLSVHDTASIIWQKTSSKSTLEDLCARELNRKGNMSLIMYSCGQKLACIAHECHRNLGLLMISLVEWLYSINQHIQQKFEYFKK